ncbi:hypothetical protein F0562_017984 [Nyssa sinensis]|uniref:Uncharacterized protein n=1 Tax=Nyssa sinensis TaxID=561372 RepID=A0A5J4Z883_9ASTE|nr:hypothetical protein F0562_017984 [Nyssa sinensis]
MRWQHLRPPPSAAVGLGHDSKAWHWNGQARRGYEGRVMTQVMSGLGLWALQNIVGLGKPWVQSQHVSCLVEQSWQNHGYNVVANGYVCSCQTKKLYFDMGRMGSDSPDTQLPAQCCLHKAFLVAGGRKVDILGSLVFRNGTREGVGALPRRWNGDCAPVNMYLGLGFNDLFPCS